MTTDIFTLADTIAQKERELHTLRSELALHRTSSRLPSAEAEAVVVCCRLQDHRVALLASEISEVVRMAELSEIPGAPVWFMGFLAVSSQRIPVLDLFARETGSRRTPDPSQFIVLTATRTGPCGLVVEAIEDLATIHGSQIHRPAADAPFGAHVIGAVELQGSTRLLLSAAPLSLYDVGDLASTAGTAT